MKFSLKTELPALIVLATSIVLSFYFYQNFPETVATHWNFQGKADGFSSKTFGAFFFPALLLLMYALFWVMPYFDPKKERYEEFKKVYAFFRQTIIIVLGIIYWASGFYNLGYNINIGLVSAWTIGLMMLGLGNYMGKIKPNWFFGIKTPWTLSSENVWNKTHRVGGVLFIIFGLIMIVMPFLPENIGLALFLGWAIVLVIGTAGYSYWLFLKEKK